jgi:hypothetical protein
MFCSSWRLRISQLEPDVSLGRKEAIWKTPDIRGCMFVVEH